MKLMKKNKSINTNLKILIAFIFGIIISTTLSYTLAATLVNSKDVYYEDNSGLAVNNVQAAIDGTCTKFSNQLQEFLLKVYPVGSIYISYNSTNPGNLFGGTWENYGNGRVLKGINSGTAGQTGGSDTVTLTTANLPAHTHTYDKVNANTESHTLTIDEMPSHSHSFANGGYSVVVSANSSSVPTGLGIDFVSGGGWYQGKTTSSAISTSGGGKGHTHSILTTSSNTGSTGSSTPTAINVQNPYITVYMWRRTS